MISRPKPFHIFLMFVAIAILAYGAHKVWQYYEVSTRDPFTARQARAEAREREILDMDEAAFDRFLKGIDLVDLATVEDNPYEEESARDATKDQLTGALTRMVLEGDMQRWELFQQILKSKVVYGAEYYVKSAIQSMKDRGADFGEFHELLYTHIMSKLTGDDWLRSEEVEVCLMIDADRTLAAFNDPDAFDVSSSKYYNILWGCLDQNVLLDLEHLRAMLQKGKEQLAQPKLEDEESWRDRTSESVAMIVKMLAMHGADDAAEEATFLLNTFEFESYAAVQLSQVITSQYGIDDMDSYMEARYAMEVKREFPFEKGDELFRTWVSVTRLDGEVRNGGFTQYFANNCGYQFIDAIAAFERIGEKDVCRILIPIREAFDAKKPVGDYSAAKFQKIFADVEVLLDESNGPYYAASNHACAKLNLYLMERLKEERAVEAAP